MRGSVRLCELVVAELHEGYIGLAVQSVAARNAEILCCVVNVFGLNEQASRIFFRREREEANRFDDEYCTAQHCDTLGDDASVYLFHLQLIFVCKHCFVRMTYTVSLISQSELLG